MSAPTRGRRNPTTIVPPLARLPWSLAAKAVDEALKHQDAAFDSLPSPHADTHLQDGADPLQTPGTPAELTLNSAADVGSGIAYALEDHRHALDLGLTTKGDLLAYTGSGYTRLGVGANDQVLIADSTQATGWRWGTVPVTPNTVVTPPQLTANTDNYALAVGQINRLSTDAARDLTGLVAAASGTTRLLVNVGAFNLVLKHQVTSTAANRFLCQGAADITLGPDDAADVWYDAVVSRWRAYLR